jgi:hypothetical protein
MEKRDKLNRLTGHNEGLCEITKTIMDLGGGMTEKEIQKREQAPILPLIRTCVEAGSNTSTVNLRVVRGDEMGLKRPRHSLSG